MTKTASDPDAALIQRCKSILIERAKNGSGPVDVLNMAHLLDANSAECYRAMSSIPGVVIERSRAGSTLDKFSLQP